MKVLERVFESCICSQVDINNMQFGLMSGCSTKDAYMYPLTNIGEVPY